MKRQFGLRSIRYKLFAGVLLVTAAALLILGVSIIIYDLNDFKNRLYRELNTQANLLGLSSAPALEFHDQKLAESSLAMLRVQPEILAAAIYNKQGEIFASYNSNPDEPVIFPNSPPSDGKRIKNDKLLVFHPIVSNNEVIGTLFLKANYPVNERLWQYTGIILVVMALTLIVSMLLALWLQAKVTRPILNVTALARKVIEKRDYSLRAEKKSNDEVGYLVESFNGLLAEVEYRSQALQQLNAELEQRVLVRTAELEMANKELESFSYSVSHDLRSPLRAIDGFSQALVEDYAEKFDDTGRDYIARVRAAAQRMGQLIDDLLKLSRVINRSDFIQEQLDLTEMAENVIADLQYEKPEREVAINIHRGLIAWGDARLLRIVLENLLNNAWKYTAKRQYACIEFGRCQHNEQDCFFVKDNGAGFDMTYADKLFGAFQRLHDAREFSGTGIGLATVQRIIHRHGGHIWAEAKVGEGATFYFTLERSL